VAQFFESADAGICNSLPAIKAEGYQLGMLLLLLQMALTRRC
jgi:hypothetical protein